MIVREIGRTTLAAVRYMILNLMGSGLFLLGIVLLYAITGHLLMIPMQNTIAGFSRSGADMTSVMLSLGIITIGLSIKSGLFPFHFWMPDTYGWSTPTSGSILSSLVSKAYIFLLFKIYYRVIGPSVFEGLPIRKIIFVLGIMGMIFGSVSAMRQKNINRMVAFSAAAMFQIFAHSVTKSLLFLTTPRLSEVSGHSLLFRNLQGSAHRAKDAGLFFLLCSLSMVGIPIFAGFSAKLNFATAAAEAGNYRILFYTMIALAVSSVLNALYFIRTCIRIYTSGRGGADIYAPGLYEKANARTGADRPFGETTVSGADEPFMSRLGYWIPAVILTGLNLYLGLFSWQIVGLLEKGLAMFS